MGPRGAAQGDRFDSPTSPRRHSAYSASFRDDATIVGIHALQIMSLCGVYTYEYIHMYRVCIIFSYAYIYTLWCIVCIWLCIYHMYIYIYNLYIILSDINHKKTWLPSLYPNTFVGLKPGHGAQANGICLYRLRGKCRTQAWQIDGCMGNGLVDKTWIKWVIYG